MSSDFFQYIGVAIYLFSLYMGVGNYMMTAAGLRLIAVTILAIWSVQVDDAPLFIMFSVMSGLYAIAISAPIIREFLRRDEVG